MATTQTRLADESGPRVLTVVSCGETKQDLDDGETVPARELYQSSVHTCKDRFARHSHGYCIASAKFGLVDAGEELPEYDQTLDDKDAVAERVWAEDVAADLRERVGCEGYDAVVLVGGRTYVDPLRPHFHTIDAVILTPWQTEDGIEGVGQGMAWCNDETNWPVNVERVEEIAAVVSEK